MAQQSQQPSPLGNEHRASFKVRFGELDPYGHVNHSVYFSYLEFGRTEALEAHDLEMADIAAKGLQLVVTKVDVRFRQAAGPGDELTVETTIGELKRASAVWSQRIVRGAGESTEVLITAEITTAVTDLDGRPIRPQPILKRCYAMIMRKYSTRSVFRSKLSERPMGCYLS